MAMGLLRNALLNLSSDLNNATSARLRSVMSRATLEAPTIAPVMSRIGEMDTDSLEMLNALATADARQNVGLLTGPLRGQQHLDWLAYSFGVRIPEYLLSPGIPRVDGSVQPLGNDGVLGGIDHGR